MKKRDPFYDAETTCSATEYTGMIPAAVQDDAQVDAYDALGSVPRPTPQNHSRHKKD